MELLRKLVRTSWAEKGLLFRAAVLVLLIRIGLSVLSFKRLQSMLDGTADPARRKRTKDESYIDDVVWAVRALARRTLGDKPCLVQALAARWMLGRAGFDTRLRIGVVKSPKQELLAHAWLDYDGDTVIGGRSSTSRFKPLEVLRPARDAR
jgi:hypothetical protein